MVRHGWQAEATSRAIAKVNEMKNAMTMRCDKCGAENRINLDESTPDHEKIACSACGHALATVGQLHAKIAQEALGLGADDLSDDHVPLGGPPFGETT